MKKFKHQCELHVIRVCPNPMKGELLNAGILLRDTSAEEPKAMLAWSNHLHKISSWEPMFDVEQFQESVREFEPLLLNVEDLEKHARFAEDFWPDGLEISSAAGVFTDSFDAEFKLLKKQYLGRFRQAEKKQRARGAIYGSAKAQFENSGVWDLLLKDVAVADYVPGDSLKLDFGYKAEAGNEFRFMHCIPLRKSGDKVKSFAFSVSSLKAALKQAHHDWDSRMWAFVEPDLQRKESREVQYLWETLEEEYDVTVAPEIAGVVAQAREVLKP